MSQMDAERDQRGEAHNRSRAQTEKLEVDDRVLKVINNAVDRHALQDPAYTMPISGSVPEV